jgi:hypothetical protein
MPRFVVLEHDYPTRHWDFMLEDAGKLRTWRLAAPPQANHQIRAQKSFDHRSVYLEYEGPVSGDRGNVVRWDAGTFEWLLDEPGLAKVMLAGRRLRGTATLREESGNEWVVGMGDD